MSRLILLTLLSLTLLLTISCDWSAMWDLRRAEKMLNVADKLNAEFWAEKEYRKAQKAFEEAMDLARVRDINAARDKAAEARDWAEEAVMWSRIRIEDMDREKASLNSKKY